MIMQMPSMRALNSSVIPLSEVPVEARDLTTSGGGALVMVVDDERLIADTLSAILRKNGFSTVTAYDGPGALELTKSTDPTMLLSDVSMPGMTGIELAKAMADASPACKVLLFSGHAGAAEQVMEACVEGYEMHFVAKPVHPAVLVNRVSTLLGMEERAKL